jgi:hypothetical protein
MSYWVDACVRQQWLDERDAAHRAPPQAVDKIVLPCH